MEIFSASALCTLVFMTIAVQAIVCFKSELDVAVSILNAELGQTAILRCEARPKGSIMTDVHWKHNNAFVFSASKKVNEIDKNTPTGKLKGRNVTGRFGKSGSYMHHDLEFTDSRVTDVGMYTCIIFDDKQQQDYDSTELKLVVSPRTIALWNTSTDAIIKGPYHCCNKKTIKISEKEKKASLACIVDEAYPHPSVKWEADVQAEMKEIFNVTYRYGVKLKRIKNVLTFNVSSEKKWRYDLNCTVLAPDAKTGAQMKHELCITIVQDKKDIYTLGTLITVGAVFFVLFVVIISFTCTLTFGLKQGLNFKLIKLNAGCSSASYMLALVGIFASRIVLIWEYKLPNHKLPVFHTIVLQPTCLAVAAGVILVRFVANSMALRLHRKGKDEDTKYCAVESRLWGRLRFIFGMFCGPGVLYMFMLASNHLQDKEGSEDEKELQKDCLPCINCLCCTEDGKERHKACPSCTNCLCCSNDGKERHKVCWPCINCFCSSDKKVLMYAAQPALVSWTMLLDIAGIIIAGTHICVYWLMASKHMISDDKAIFYMEGGSLHSILIYTSVAAGVVFHTYIYLMMHCRGERFMIHEGTEIGRERQKVYPSCKNRFCWSDTDGCIFRPFFPWPYDTSSRTPKPQLPSHSAQEEETVLVEATRDRASFLENCPNENTKEDMLDTAEDEKNTSSAQAENNMEKKDVHVQTDCSPVNSS